MFFGRFERIFRHGKPIRLVAPCAASPNNLSKTEQRLVEWQYWYKAGLRVKLKRTLVAAVIGIGSMYVPQRAFSQATDHWFVVRDARDLTFAFEFVCLGDRTTAQDVVWGLRLLENDGSIHALPERAFRVQQAAGLISSVFKELLCAGDPAPIEKQQPVKSSEKLVSTFDNAR
jgi:hypothetical protein